MAPKDLRYTNEHEWIRVENGVGTVGITDHAQDSLGDITFVELPEVGQSFDMGEEVAAVESSKAAGSIYAPVAGKITEVNESIEDAPEQVNEDPYGEGWIYKIEIDAPDQLDGLMDAEAYEKFLEDTAD
ncbi:MAG: glycine cleavage system protein GcvH [Candidatus Sumerlaeota bacterium]